jgi:hypothetical protein
MGGIYNGREKMTREEIQDLKYGTPVQVGLDFKGLVWKVELVVKATMGEIWRVWFIDQYPVRTIEANISQIKIIEDDPHLHRQVGWENCD